GSKGSYGTLVGVGIADIRPNHEDTYAASILGLSNLAGEVEARRWLRVTAVRGTPWPLDLGFSVSQLQGTTTSQISGILQATLYEELGLPAISIRYQHSQLLGLRRDDAVLSQSLELLLTQ